MALRHIRGITRACVGELTRLQASFDDELRQSLAEAATVEKEDKSQQLHYAALELKSAVKSLATHATVAFTKGATVYLVPTLLLYRRLSGLRRAAAIGALCATFRLVARLLSLLELYLRCALAKYERQRQQRAALAKNVFVQDPTATPPNTQEQANTTVGRWLVDGPQLDLPKWLATTLERLFATMGTEGTLPNFVAGLTSTFVGLHFDRFEISTSSVFMFWFLIRGVRALTPDSLVHPLGSTFFMCLAAAQILSSWICGTTELPISYLRFLDHHGGDKPKSIMRQMSFSPPISCIAHPGQTCTQHFIDFLVAGMYRSCRIYFPLYVLFFIFSKEKSLFLLAANTIRSSCFLTAYCSVAWASGCLFYKFFTPVVRKHAVWHVASAGLATIIERPRRRAELAAYCMMYACESLYRMLLHHKYIRPMSSKFQAFAIILAAAAIAMRPSMQPTLVSRWLLAISNANSEVDLDKENSKALQRSEDNTSRV